MSRLKNNNNKKRETSLKLFKGELGPAETTTKRSIINRGRAVTVLMIVLLVGLIGQLANLMLVDSKNYKQQALSQYTSEYTIPAARGVIYDRNMNVLAENITVETCFISPADIESETERVSICSGLSQILDVPYDEIYQRALKTTSRYQVIKKELNAEIADMVRTFVLANELSHCVYLRESTKRYYPYGSLAANLIGFTGSDGQGLAGLEAYYDSVLSGTDGRVVIGRDGNGDELPFKYESYIDAVDGTDIVLTIDIYIQSVVQKYCEQAYYEYDPNEKVMCTIMDVTNGEVLALGVYPTYDLNDPYTLDSDSQALLDAYVGTGEQVSSYKTELLNKMWRNKFVSDTYEPGSTFKIVTTAIALEEGVSTVDDTYFCQTMHIANYDIRCHSHVSHGEQSLATALQNSCNPAFVQLGLKIGSPLFLKYFGEFGYTESTGADIGGQASTIYDSGPLPDISLAVYSFGQTFKVTPLAHLRAVSAVANDGYLVTPHFVKSQIDDDRTIIKSYEYPETRQVISSTVSEQIMSILAEATTSGSTVNARVEGYNVAAKTGTSQKRDVVSEEGFEPYVSSCVAFAPAEAPQISILFAVDEPTGDKYYGGVVAAPYVSKVLSEVLPYMGFEKTAVSSDYNNIKLIDYRGAKLSDAILDIENRGLNVRVVGNGNTVISQFPKYNTMVNKDGVVVLVTDESEQARDCVVPDVSNCTISEAIKRLTNAGLNISVIGYSKENSDKLRASTQSHTAGTYVTAGTVVEVTFIDPSVTD